MENVSIEVHLGPELISTSAVKIIKELFNYIKLKRKEKNQIKFLKNIHIGRCLMNTMIVNIRKNKTL